MELLTEFHGARVGIIGATGRMGSWFADLLERSGKEVFRVGRKTDLTPAVMAGECDVVVISVPIVDTVDVIREIGPLVPEDGLMMDLTSVKKEPVEAMLKYSLSEVVGAHPLFGPGEKFVSECSMAVCPGRGKRGLQWLMGIMEGAGIKTVSMDPEKHDHMMGLIQGVNHFSTLALGLCTTVSGYSSEDVLNCSTQTFRRRLDRIKLMVEESSELFESLIMGNPWAGKFIDQYIDAAQRLAKITRENNRKGFREFFDSLKTYFEVP